MKRIAAALTVLVLALSLTACTRAPKAIEPTEDSFVICVRFDTDVDIFEMQYARGEGESGGFCYADGSKLNDVVYMSFTDEIWGEGPKKDGFFLSVGPVIEGHDVPMVSIEAKYGNTYTLLVSGNAETGYTAVQMKGEA